MIRFEFLIAVDGGGTNCRARVSALDGTILGEGVAGSANVSGGVQPALEQAHKSINCALANANLRSDVLAQSSAVFGLAGIVDATDANLVEQRTTPFGRLKVVSDAEIACRGAFLGKNGAVLICGTGSAAFVACDQQKHALFGWGFRGDDSGSASSIGKRAVEASLAAIDGIGHCSRLTDSIADALGSTRGNIVRWLGEAQPRDFGRLAPEVFSAANAGDPIGIRLVREMVCQIERKIQRINELGAPTVCLMGGLVEAVMPWMSPWARNCIVAPLSDALSGATHIAKENAACD